MLKRKLEDGTIVGLRVEAVAGGMMLALDHQEVDESYPLRQLFIVMNPVEAIAFHEGLNKCRYEAKYCNGIKIKFRSPGPGDSFAPWIRLNNDNDDCIVFPLREEEVKFLRKAIEQLAQTLLFIGTWSGEPEEL